MSDEVKLPPGWLIKDCELAKRRSEELGLVETKGAAAMPDPLKPSPALLCALGSIIIHVQEGASDDGHHFDIVAASALLSNRDVQEWLSDMQKMAMLPVRRKP